MKISQISKKIFLITLITIALGNTGFPQSTNPNLDKESGSTAYKTNNEEGDSLSQVKKAIHQTGKVAQETWKKTEPVRKEATEKVQTYLKKTEPARKAALDSAKKYLDIAVKKTGEAVKEFKEGWDEGAKK